MSGNTQDPLDAELNGPNYPTQLQIYEERIRELEGIVQRKTALIHDLTEKLLEKTPRRGDLVIHEVDEMRSITVFGIKYAIELFRLIGTIDIGRCFQIIERKDGVVTVRSLSVVDLGNGDFKFHVDG